MNHTKDDLYEQMTVESLGLKIMGLLALLGKAKIMGGILIQSPSLTTTCCRRDILEN